MKPFTLFFIFIFLFAVNKSYSQNIDNPISETDTIKSHRPKITLTTTAESNITTSPAQSPTYSKTISHFYLDSATWNTTKIGFMDKNIKPYLKIDKEAYKYFRRNRITSPIQTASVIIGISSLFVLGYELSGGSNEIGPTALIAGTSILSGFISQKLSAHWFRKAVKTYNKNSNYCYCDGLEKIYGK